MQRSNFAVPSLDQNLYRLVPFRGPLLYLKRLSRPSQAYFHSCSTFTFVPTYLSELTMGANDRVNASGGNDASSARDDGHPE